MKPTSIVTFLFTDIEGSTRLVQVFPRDYTKITFRERLNDRFNLLTSGKRTALPRQ